MVWYFIARSKNYKCKALICNAAHLFYFSSWLFLQLLTPRGAAWPNNTAVDFKSRGPRFKTQWGAVLCPLERHITP